MKFKPLLGAALSGKLGGIVASHNAGGGYFRAFAIPTNPGSPQQEVVRVATANNAIRWQDNLLQSQRDGWQAYADAVPITDALGNPINIPPLAMYNRSNVSRIQAGLPRVDDAPTLLNLGAFSQPTISAITAAADTIDIAFDNADLWANEDDSSMLLYCSQGKSPTTNFFKGPYRYAGRIDGDAITPPTSPATITLPFAVSVGQRVFIKIRVTRADGRLSTSFRKFGTAA